MQVFKMTIPKLPVCQMHLAVVHAAKNIAFFLPFSPHCVNSAAQNTRARHSKRMDPSITEICEN